MGFSEDYEFYVNAKKRLAAIPQADGFTGELPKPLPRVVGLDRVGHICHGCAYPGDPHNHSCPNAPLMGYIRTGVRRVPTQILGRYQPNAELGYRGPVQFGRSMYLKNIHVPDSDKDSDNMSAASLISSLYGRLKTADGLVNILEKANQELRDAYEMLSNPYQKLLNAQDYLCRKDCEYDKNISDAINILASAVDDFIYSARRESNKKYRW